MNIASTVKIFKALMQGPASRIELATTTGVCPKAVGKVVTELRAQKLVYVIAYSSHSDGRNRVKIYAIGEGEDARPKKSQSQEDRSRKSYAKKVRALKAANIKTTFAGGISPWTISN